MVWSNPTMPPDFMTDGHALTASCVTPPSAAGTSVCSTRPIQNAHFGEQGLLYSNHFGYAIICSRRLRRIAANRQKNHCGTSAEFFRSIANLFIDDKSILPDTFRQRIVNVRFIFDKGYIHGMQRFDFLDVGIESCLVKHRQVPGKHRNIVITYRRTIFLGTGTKQHDFIYTVSLCDAPYSRKNFCIHGVIIAQAAESRQPLPIFRLSRIVLSIRSDSRVSPATKIPV